MNVGIALGVGGLAWTALIGWLFYRLAERNSDKRHVQGESADTLREQSRQEEFEEQVRFQQAQVVLQRRSRAREKFEKRDEYWDARVEDDGTTLVVWNGSGDTYTSVEVTIFDQNSPDGNPLLFSLFWTGFSFLRLHRDGENSSFDDVEKIVVKATNGETNRKMEVTIPLDPFETMPDFRAA